MLLGALESTFSSKQNECVGVCVRVRYSGCVDSREIDLATRRSDAEGAHGDDGIADREAAMRGYEPESATTAVSSSAFQPLSFILAGRTPCGRA